MKIFIEEESYHIEELEQVFSHGQFYTQKGLSGTIKSVGYYHAFSTGELVFILPKVFMKDQGKTVFGLTKDDLLNYLSENPKHEDKHKWIRDLSIYFYKSLVAYKRRHPYSTLVNYSPLYQLRSTERTKEYAYLDIVLSFINFYKRYRTQIRYKHIEAINRSHKNPKWERTVRKGSPIDLGNGTLVYDQIRNKQKTINTEEELITYFFSIINHFNEQHQLNVRIDSTYTIIRGRKFEALKKIGLNKLRKIKYRYYSDVLKTMHQLCQLYFSHSDHAKGKMQDDFIVVNNYNIVFEDMVDKLLSDELKEVQVNEVSLGTLKNHDDGKIVDHIFDHRSLLDDSHVFYIGDSKYYKSGSEAGKSSRYKQITYAKNVIQYNIDLLNDRNRKYRDNIRYRDETTEGYNITPNFFIYGYIGDAGNYDKHELLSTGDIMESFHFPYRLFDRDTLFVHQYKINFLFVLKAYSTSGMSSVEAFKAEVKQTFRQRFIDYFNDADRSGYSFYQLKAGIQHEGFMTSNFRALNGKCMITSDGKFLMAKHRDDHCRRLATLLQHFDPYELSPDRSRPPD